MRTPRIPAPLAAPTASALALALALAGVTLPATAHAAPAPPEGSEAKTDSAAGEAAPEDPTFAEAKRLFEAGAARYTAADYGAAIDLWLEAYAQLPATLDNQLIKAQLIYNVARAQKKWFDIDEDIKHLRQSREILTRYAGEVDTLYEPAQAGLEREKIEEQIAELDGQIAAWEREQARREAELAERMRPTFDFDADAREEKRNKAMLGAGATLTILGLGSVAMVISGVVLAGNAEETIGDYPTAAQAGERERLANQGLAGNALMIVGTLSGSLFLIAGLPLVGVGASAEAKRKKRRKEAGVDKRARLRLDGGGPLLIPAGAGLSLTGRF